MDVECANEDCVPARSLVTLPVHYRIIGTRESDYYMVFCIPYRIIIKNHRKARATTVNSK